MTNFRKVCNEILVLHLAGLNSMVISDKLKVDYQTVLEIVASVNGFTNEQKQDYAIVLSLDTMEKMEEWRDTVGEADVMYGATLLDMAALNVLEYQTQRGPYLEAGKILNKIRQL